MAKRFASFVAVRAARILYRRWEGLEPAARRPLEPLAEDVKNRALDLRGVVDDGSAERELEVARAELAEALEELERRQARHAA
jgi:hypothetical protein